MLPVQLEIRGRNLTSTSSTTARASWCGARCRASSSWPGPPGTWPLVRTLGGAAAAAQPAVGVSSSGDGEGKQLTAMLSPGWRL